MAVVFNSGFFSSPSEGQSSSSSSSGGGGGGGGNQDLTSVLTNGNVTSLDMTVGGFTATDGASLGFGGTSKLNTTSTGISVTGNGEFVGYVSGAQAIASNQYTTLGQVDAKFANVAYTNVDNQFSVGQTINGNLTQIGQVNLGVSNNLRIASSGRVTIGSSSPDLTIEGGGTINLQGTNNIIDNVAQIRTNGLFRLDAIGGQIRVGGDVAAKFNIVNDYDPSREVLGIRGAVGQSKAYIRVLDSSSNEVFSVNPTETTINGNATVNGDLSANNLRLEDWLVYEIGTSPNKTFSIAKSGVADYLTISPTGATTINGNATVNSILRVNAPITSYSNNTQTIFTSYNTSVGSAQQLFIAHDFTDVEIRNLRGGIIIGSDTEINGNATVNGNATNPLTIAAGGSRKQGYWYADTSGIGIATGAGSGFTNLFYLNKQASTASIFANSSLTAAFSSSAITLYKATTINGNTTVNGTGAFTGTVSGADATASNHFVTKSQLDSIASPTLDDVLFNGNTSTRSMTVGGVTISNATFGEHLKLTRGLDTIDLSVSGGQALISGGFSPNITNSINLGRVGFYWKNLYLQGSIFPNGSLSVEGSATINGNATVNGSGSFTGTVSGADATASNHFVTKSQLDNIASPTLDDVLNNGNTSSLGMTVGGATINGDLTATGNVYANGTAFYGDNKNAIQFSDSYLRLNQSGNFANGVYTPGEFRADGGLKSYRNDSGQLFGSYNTSAGGPLQFQISHNFGNVDIENRRGAILIKNNSSTTATFSSSAITFYRATTINGTATVNGNLTFTGTVNGGSSSQFLKGDGSLDGNTYLTSADLSNYARKDIAETFASNVTVNGRVVTDEVRCRTGQQLVLNAGESSSYATGQTDEIVYVNAESGLQINTSPDNWASGWAGRVTHSFGSTSSTIGTSLTVSGNANVSGTISGNGSGLTNLNASNISSGTLSAARLPSTFGPASALELTSSIDLNTLLQAADAGFYYQAANADTSGNNYPNSQAGSLIVQKSATSGSYGATQLYQTYNPSTPELYFRSGYSTISPWRRVIHDGNYTSYVTKSYVDGLGINATTLDGIDGANFLRSDTSDTMNGTLTVTGGEALRLTGSGGFISFFDGSSTRHGFIQGTGSDMFFRAETGKLNLQSTTSSVDITASSIINLSQTTQVRSGSQQPLIVESTTTSVYQNFRTSSGLTGYIGSGSGLVSGYGSLDMAVRAQGQYVVIATNANNARGRFSSLGLEVFGATTVSGNVTANNFVKGSARHKKKIIEDLNFSWQEACKVQPRQYIKKASDSVEFGYIIDELPEKLQEVASEDNESLDYDSVNTAMIAAMMKEIKELRKEIEELKK